MCEANVYLSTEENGEELLLENVNIVVPKEDGELLLENIFGERKLLKARIKEMELVNHRIVIVRK